MELAPTGESTLVSGTMATTRKPSTPSTPKRIGKYGTLKPAGEEKPEGLALGPEATKTLRHRQEKNRKKLGGKRRG